MQLHATQTLLAKLPLNTQGQLNATARSQWLFDRPPLNANALGDWHGKILVTQRRNTLLLVHTQTRFPLVLPALKKADWTELNDRFGDALMNTLLKCGANEAQLEAAHHCMRALQVDRQCDRSALGTLNHLGQDLEAFLYYNRVDVTQLGSPSVGAMLANRPCTVKGRKVLWPNKEMLALLDQLAKAGEPAIDTAPI